MKNPSAPLKPGVLAVPHWAIYSPMTTTIRKLKPIGRMGGNEFYLINSTFAQAANVLSSPEKIPDPMERYISEILSGSKPLVSGMW